MVRPRNNYHNGDTTMNITATLSKNRKLTKGPRIPAWNVGTTKESMHASCQKVSCPFYDGGQFINPITGEKVDSESIRKTEGTIDTPQTYLSLIHI